MGNAAQAAPDPFAKTQDPAPITRVKFVNGIKVPWKPVGSAQIQDIVADKTERFVEGEHFLWIYGPGGRRVGIPYANVKQVE